LLLLPKVLCTKQASENSNLTVVDARGNSKSLSTITVDYNPQNGSVAALVEAAINKHRNDPTAMKERSKRFELSKKTPEVEEATWKLTSGTDFFNNMVALNSDTIWEHQKRWHDEKESKANGQKAATRKLFDEKQQKSNNIGSIHKQHGQ
jgi:hypothetical protein